MSEYNYEHFPLDGDIDDFIRFPNVARVSSKAPGGNLIDADSGAEVHLGELYGKGVTVMEFGSYT